MAAGVFDRRVENETTNNNSMPSTLTTLNSSNLPTNISGLLWEDKPRTIRELISSYRLPLAVKLRSGHIPQLFLEKENGSTNKDVVNSITDSSDVNSAKLGKSSPNGHFPSGFESKDTSSQKPEETVLQIHEMRRKRIILARKMTWEKRQNDYVVTGEQVEIPAAFKGKLTPTMLLVSNSAI